MKHLSPKEFLTQLNEKIVIGHCGHRDLLEEDVQVIRRKVESKLKEITGGNLNGFVLITGFAEGADELVARAALSLGMKVILLIIDKDIFPRFDQGDLERINSLGQKTNLYVYQLGACKRLLHQTPYEILGEVLVKHSTHLLALWDGVDTGKRNGTWETVKNFRYGELPKGKEANRSKLHHLFTPRKANHIPYAHAYLNGLALPRSPYDWESTDTEIINRKRKGIPKNLSDFVYRFIIPVTLAIIVFVTGWFGYLADNNNINKNGNAFFFAANLITLNVSVFEQPASFWTKTARVFGAGLAAYGFGLAFYFALGKENLHRMRFWLSRKLGVKFSVVIGLDEIAFDIIKDLRSQKSNVLKTRVVVLTPDIHSPYIRLARNEGAWVIIGIPTDSISLQKTYFPHAEQVFVVTDSEEENVRCLMEMDQMASRDKKSSNEEWFVHIQDKKLKQLLQQSISARTNYALTVFSHAENTARRMFAGFPELQRSSHDTLIAIVGFGHVGKALALKSIQQLVFTETPAPKVLVFYTEIESGSVEDFKQEYPYLFQTNAEAIEDPFKRVTKWTFFGGHKSDSLSDRIVFYPLPIIPQQLTHPQSPLLDKAFDEGKLKVFSCLHTGLDSASFLTAVLPGLEQIKLQHPNFDIQAFCFYNFPDEEEEAYLEQKLNALAPHLPVKCFGNYLYEFSCEAIRNKEADHLARQIALWYYLLYDFGSAPQSARRSLEIEELFGKLITKVDELKKAFLAHEKMVSYEETMKAKNAGLKQLWYVVLSDDRLMGAMREMMRHCWKSLSETDREGNRQAADHLWVKIAEFDKYWELSGQIPDIQHFKTFWTAQEIRDLGLAEHRRWNTMKILDGWRPFVGADWKAYKENYKAQKLHNLLVPFEELPKNEKGKDYHQIEGIPFFVALLYKTYYHRNIQFIKRKIQ